MESRYVPVKNVKCKNGKSMWLSHKALKAVKHRHKIFQKYRNSSHPACKNANAEASKTLHRSRRYFEHRLGSKIKDDKKSFFAYARCKAKTKIRVGPLVPDGKEIKDTTQIAEMFNDQFSSVFTAENITDISISLLKVTATNYVILSLLKKRCKKDCCV